MKFSFLVSNLTRSAASIAALLGNVNPSAGLAMAKSKFRSISFEDLSAEDFSKNKEEDGDKNKLFGKTKQIELGKCDAFMSHSWSDDGVEKYEALRQWAVEFEEREGRSPNIWLDKVNLHAVSNNFESTCLYIIL